MDHNQAIENQAVERYMLQAMPADERDQFEEHYFSCAECAADIRAAARFETAARDVFLAPAPEPPARRSWWSFPMLAPALASVALLAVVIFQASNREFEGAQPLAAVALRTATRGADVARIPPGGPFFTVYFDLPPAPAPASSYQCTVANSSGKAVAVVETAAPKSGEPVNLLFKRSDFPPGQYTLTVQDAAKTAVLQLNFLVE